MPAEPKGLFCSICLKAAGLYDSCRGLATQVLLTLPTQMGFGTIQGLVYTGKFLQLKEAEHISSQESGVREEHQPC